MTLTQCVKESYCKAQVTNFIANFWYSAESHGKFKDGKVVHITKYEKHIITTIIRNKHTAYLKITDGKYYVLCLVTGSKYTDLVFLKARKNKARK